MKSNIEFDRELAAALRDRADGVSVSAEAERRMWQEIEKIKMSRRKREVLYMKRFSVRLVCAICAVFVLSCMTVLAASGVIGGWVGHNIGGSDVSSYAALEEKLLPQLDYKPQVVEEFANGFKLESAHLGSMQAMDENGIAFGQDYTSLDMRYALDGVRVNLSIDNAPQTEAEVGVGTPEPLIRAVGDVELAYQEMPYKFVPPGYELSDEDWALQESGALEISYGSDEVEETLCCGVSWRQDGLNYYLFGWDLELGGEAMLDMAEELLAE